ncbi:hypothetical protein BGX31_008944 [Mortierella sp. GBA43]|nr:hypothetical protein BGX31_008944 [Mortierella sp. GBA43]
MPTPTSSTERFYGSGDASSILRRDNAMPSELPRRQTIPSDDLLLLDDGVSRLNLSETVSSVENQVHAKSLESVRSYRVCNLDDTRNDSPDRTEEGTDDHDLPEDDWEPQDEDMQEPESKVRGEPQACLFVASLAASRTDVQLVESVTEYFSKWGSLLNVKVLKDWMQRPYSFVQFERVEDAQRAMAEAQNTVIDGRHIRIEQARVNRTLFILRFGRSTTEQDITDVLEQYGPVEDVSIFHDLGPARNKRYAFAKFAYRDDAIRAYMVDYESVLLNVAQHGQNNSKWTVEWAPNLSSQSQIEKESVFVGQLNPELTTEATLRDRFQDYGNIQCVHLVKRSKPGTTRLTAFAFIEFDNEYSARQAIEHEVVLLDRNQVQCLSSQAQLLEGLPLLMTEIKGSILGRHPTAVSLDFR